MTSGDQGPRRLHGDSGFADRVFGAIARGGGGFVLAVMLLVGGFLTYQAWQALRTAGWSFLTTQAWEPDAGHFGIAAVLTDTVIIAAIAVVIAVPLSVGSAMYISEYATGRWQRLLISLVDLMAAVPSVVYGLFGLFFLQHHVITVSRWVSTYLGWIPLFGVPSADHDDPLVDMTVYTAAPFIAGIVVAMMCTPIMCSIMREVFSQAPMGEREGAYALGATRWEMIKRVVLPFGRGGMIGGTMLGLGRALGETVGVYLIISPVFTVQWHILQTGGHSVAALIVNRYGTESHFGVSALMAAGLSLFLMTLVVNFLASMIVARSRSGAATE